MMIEDAIRAHLVALNAAWQRYAQTIDEQLDPETTEGLNRDYLAAWEELYACGIVEWMLEYDAATLTFSLPAMNETSHDDFATMPIPAVTNEVAGNWQRSDEPERERMQLL